LLVLANSGDRSEIVSFWEEFAGAGSTEVRSGRN
jgi:hypothetical protein